MHGVLSVQSYWERCAKSGFLFSQSKVLAHNGGLDQSFNPIQPA
jgi:hypothetical protein